MKTLIYLPFLLAGIPLSAQCTFEYPHTYEFCQEDYMDVFDLPDEKHIVAIGVNIPRIGEDTSKCDFGFLFRKFDYCGNVLTEKRYGHFDSVALTRSYFSGITDNGEISSYGNSGYNITHKNKHSYFAGFGEDAQQHLYNVLLVLDENGNVVLYKLYPESGLNEIQHLIPLKDGRILVVLRKHITLEYISRWLSTNGAILKEATLKLPSDQLLYYGKVSSDDQLYFTAKNYQEFDPTTFMVIKMDTLGNKVWEYEERGTLGSARDMFLTDSSLLICAIVHDSILVEKKALTLVELNSDGKLITKRQIDLGNNYYIANSSISLIGSSNGNFYLVAATYKTFPQNAGISIISLSSNLNLNWFKHFYKRDNISMGHTITECSDGTLAIAGRLRKLRPNMYGSIIVKTTNEAPVGNFSLEESDLLKIYPNPVNDYLHFLGEVDLDQYFIYNLDGENILSGIINEREISISTINPGIYFLKLMDKKGKVKVNKFIKS